MDWRKPIRAGAISMSAVVACAALTTAIAAPEPSAKAPDSAPTALPAAAEPTGASLAWTSDDPVVVEARAMIHDGRLADAERLLAKDDPSASPAAKAARAEAVEIVARTRYDYSESPANLLARLQKATPAVTADLLEKWRLAGGVQWRSIDGQVAYFRREPKNMARFCDEYKAMAGAPKKPAAHQGAWTLDGHLKRVIEESERTGQPYVLPATVTATFSLTVPADAPGMKPGALVRAWLPFPQEYGKRQYNVRLVSSSPADPQIAPSATGEHPIGGAPQRTTYFEQRVSDPPKAITFHEVVEFTSQAYYPNLDEAKAQPLPADYADGNLGERLPHVVFTPKLKAAVAEAVGDETNPLAKARKIFRWIHAHIAYHAEEGYSVLPSFSDACLTRGRGDCGVKGTLFITMCRATGIPARWQSGWETKPGDPDMHDWAEFYVAPWGWLPADASYGVQPSDDPRVRDFYCGHQDLYRMIVNRDYGYPLVPPKASLRSEPADFQNGEVEVDGKNLYWDKWDYDMTFHYREKP